MRHLGNRKNKDEKKKKSYNDAFYIQPATSKIQKHQNIRRSSQTIQTPSVIVHITIDQQAEHIYW